jgi:DNA-binding MarR family transcriptional regulator
MGLVGREKSPADGRSVILSLTTKGDSLFKGVLDKRAEMARIMLQQFDDAQQKALADMLSKLIESLKSKPDRAR